MTGGAFIKNMNNLKIDLTNKVVLVSTRHLKPEVTDRRFLCEAGFGCHSGTFGEKIFGRWLSDNQKDCIGGRWVEMLAPERAECEKCGRQSSVVDMNLCPFCKK